MGVFTTPPAYEDEDWACWHRYGQLPDDEADYRLEAQEFADRESEKGPAPSWTRLPLLGGFKHG